MRRVRVYKRDSPFIDPETKLWRQSDRKFAYVALFHEWGVDYEESGDGIGTYSVAIVEKANGCVETVPAADVQFIDGTAGLLTTDPKDTDDSETKTPEA